MTRITGTDQVLLLLRERLARQGGGGVARADTLAASHIRRSPPDRMRAMAGVDALDPDARRRAVVHGLLIEELGDAVGNDPGFHAVLDGVMRILTDLPGGGDMIDRAAAALRER